MLIKYNNHLCLKKYDIGFRYCLHKDVFSLYCYEPNNTKTYICKFPNNKYVNLFNFICNHVNKI